MQTARVLYNFFEWIATTFWGLAVIKHFVLIESMEYSFREFINSSMQSIYIAVGLIYFIANGIYRHLSKKQDREEKRIRNRILEMELEQLENRRKKN